MEYPKVLILWEQFNDSTGMGVTLTNLFKNWPKEKIALAAFELNVDLCEKIRPCIKYLQLSSSTNNNEISHLKKKRVHQLFKQYIKGVFKYFYKKLGICDFRNISIKESLENLILDFEPDIFFTALGSLNRIKFVHRVHKFYPKAKLAVYIVDDWVNTTQNDRWFPMLWYNIYNNSFVKLLQESSYFMSICRDMSDAYRAQYKKEFIPFHNPVDIIQWKKITPIKKYAPHIFSIIYVGKINRDTIENIQNLSTIVDLENKNGKNIKFDIYTPSIHNFNPSNYSGVEVFPAISNSEIPSLLKSYNTLFLPLGFSNKSRAYTRLSMPTKLTEYLCSDVPILLNAPAEIAVTRYVSQNKAAMICASNNIDDLRTALNKLCNNAKICAEIVERAMHLAQKHDIHIIRESFRKILSM